MVLIPEDVNIANHILTDIETKIEKRQLIKKNNHSRLNRLGVRFARAFFAVTNVAIDMNSMLTTQMMYKLNEIVYSVAFVRVIRRWNFKAAMILH